MINCWELDFCHGALLLLLAFPGINRNLWPPVDPGLLLKVDSGAQTRHLHTAKLNEMNSRGFGAPTDGRIFGFCGCDFQHSNRHRAVVGL